MVRTALLSLLFVGLAASSAIAQIGPAAPAASRIVPMPEPREGSFGQFRVGSLLFTPRVQLTQVGVDTNVFSGDSDLRADFTATLLPQGEFFFGTESFRLRTTLAAGLVYYAKYKSQQAVNPIARVEFQQKIGPKITLFGDHGFGFRKGRPNEEIDVRTRQRTSTSQLGIQFAPTHRMAVRVAGAYSQAAFGTSEFRGVPLRSTLDHAATSAGLAFEYRLTPYTSLVAGGVLTDVRFVTASERNGSIRSGYIGIELSERALISGRARVGYSDFSARHPATPRFHAPVADVILTLRLSDWTQLTGGASREMKFSYSPQAPYYRSDMIEAAATQRLFRHFDVAAGARDYYLKYPSTFDWGGAPNDRLRVYTGSVGLHVRKLRLGVYGSHWIRPRTGGREGTIWGLTLTAGSFNVNSQGIFMGGFGQ